MPALNFQARFAAAVASGDKRQTIRAYRKDGRDPKPGDTLHLYAGMRTKACRKLGEVRCKSAKRLRIERFTNNAVPMVEVYREDGSPEWATDFFGDPFQAERRFARRDGFKNWPEMWQWFERVYGLPFEGLLIRW